MGVRYDGKGGIEQEWGVVIGQVVKEEESCMSDMRKHEKNTEKGSC